MKFSTLILLLFCFSTQLNAQLNCKTKPTSEGGTEKTCLHKNGKTSTSESWDKDQRFGKMKGFNSKGEEIFSYELRKVGGHASATIDYFPNGQVSKVYYSDAPDGGIQFYNSTSIYNEAGERTDFYETKYPYELELLEPEVMKRDPEIELNIPQDQPKVEIVECAILFSNYFEVQNGTTSTITVRANALQNNTVIGQGKEFVLQPSEKIVFDTIYTAQVGIKENVYGLEIVSHSKKRKNKKLKLIETTPAESPNFTKTWYWIIVKG